MRHLCMAHNQQFDNDDTFMLHKELFHDKKAVLPNGISPENLPNEEFIKKVEEIEKKSKPIIDNPIIQEIIPPVRNDLVPSEQKQEEPLRLTYVYQGNCPTHNCQVETLIIAAGRSTHAVGYCNGGKHQVCQKVVVPLDKKEESLKTNPDKLHNISQKPVVKTHKK